MELDFLVDIRTSKKLSSMHLLYNAKDFKQIKYFTLLGRVHQDVAVEFRTD